MAAKLVSFLERPLSKKPFESMYLLWSLLVPGQVFQKLAEVN